MSRLFVLASRLVRVADGQSLQIRPVCQRKRPALSESLAAVNKRHASTLKKLAK